MKKQDLFRLFVLCLLVCVCTVSCRKGDGDGLKTLHIPYSAKIAGMDPIFSNDKYSGNAISLVYEGLLQYHYLKRPFELEPNLAAEIPKAKDNGRTYVFKLKKGVLFHDNKCFEGGKGREMVAEDVVYSFKRTAARPDSKGWWVIKDKIVGLDQFREAVAQRKATIDTAVEGVKAIDSHTVQFKLSQPFPQFLYAFAMPFFYVVPREAVEHYGDEFINHPVGTGPFTMGKYTRTNRVEATKNPTFRKKFYPTQGSKGDKEKGLLADAGKALPLVDKVVIHINVEPQPRWLSFQAGKLDMMSIPKDNFEKALTPSRDLAPEMIAKGIQLDITPALDLTYTAFQHSKELFGNVDLRRAMSLAYDPHLANKHFYSSASLPAQSIVPPGIDGFIDGFKGPWIGPNIEKAKKMLDKAGYPGGKGLPPITFDITANSVSRQIGEFFKRRMKLIGIDIRVVTNPWPELMKKISTRQTMLHSLAWGADYPDAENFLQLLYGPNQTPGANGSNYSNKNFDEIFKKARLLPPSPERTRLYEKMYKMAADQVPLIYGVHRQSFTLVHGWLKNFKYIEFDHGVEQYYNINSEEKKTLLKKF